MDWVVGILNVKDKRGGHLSWAFENGNGACEEKHKGGEVEEGGVRRKWIFTLLSIK